MTAALPLYLNFNTQNFFLSTLSPLAHQFGYSKCGFVHERNLYPISDTEFFRIFIFFGNLVREEGGTVLGFDNLGTPYQE